MTLIVSRRSTRIRNNCLNLESLHHLVHSSFLIILLLVLVVDLEVPEFVICMRTCHNTKPVTKVVLLQIFLRQIFQVPFGQGSVSNNTHFILQCFQVHLFKVVEFSFHLDATFKKFFEVVYFHDSIFYWMSAIDVEGERRLLLCGFLGGSHFCLLSEMGVCS